MSKQAHRSCTASFTRRQALAAGAGATLGLLAPRAYAWQPADDKLRIGAVGVGGRGGANLNGVKSQRIAAICDTNPNALQSAKQKYADADTYSDWREMLERDGLDAVVISTADHHHALVAIAAMRRGLHVYCEKPLGHTPWEARQMRMVYNKRREKLATQMGTQIHATDNYRRVVELVQSGAIGNVSEAHVWCSRSIRPLEQVVLDEQPVPDGFDWNAWLGPAPDRPYNTGYWRGGNLNWNRRWDFGNGVLGDMGSHLIDLAYWALELDRPTAVESEGPDPDPHAAPPWQVLTWQHPQREGDGPHHTPCKVVWYHGPQGMKRRAQVIQPMVGGDTDINKWGIGVAFVGDKGVLTADYGKYVLSPSAEYKDFAPPARTIDQSKGHYNEWLDACKGKGTTLCNFDYSGKLIEHNLLGVAAHRAGGKLKWDASAFAFDHADANRYLNKTYRNGWRLTPEAATT
ncbi:MAG: Gfo/Idh/MocA family oxidoreductase [Phycisphaeraceae bacterium]